MCLSIRKSIQNETKRNKISPQKQGFFVLLHREINTKRNLEKLSKNGKSAFPYENQYKTKQNETNDFEIIKNSVQMCLSIRKSIQNETKKLFSYTYISKYNILYYKIITSRRKKKTNKEKRKFF